MRFRIPVSSCSQLVDRLVVRICVASPVSGYQRSKTSSISDAEYGRHFQNLSSGSSDASFFNVGIILALGERFSHSFGIICSPCGHFVTLWGSSEAAGGPHGSPTLDFHRFRIDFGPPFLELFGSRNLVWSVNGFLMLSEQFFKLLLPWRLA